MEKIIEEEAKAITGIIKGAKILVPFVISIVSVVGVYYTMEKEISDLEKDRVNDKEIIVKLEANVAQLQLITNAHSVTLATVTTDIQHIKDDTKETLDLVRSLYRNR